MVCRKLKKEQHGYYSDVKKKIEDYLNVKLDFLWEQNIRGADFFISAIGSAIEVFGNFYKTDIHTGLKKTIEWYKKYMNK